MSPMAQALVTRRTRSCSGRCAGFVYPPGNSGEKIPPYIQQTTNLNWSLCSYWVITKVLIICYYHLGTSTHGWLLGQNPTKSPPVFQRFFLWRPVFHWALWNYFNMNSWYFKNLVQTSESMDWNGCSKPTNGISPCSSPQHGYLSTSTPRRWPTSTLGHVGWLPVEPHRCFRFDSWRCSIWHIIYVPGTWNSVWYNVIWTDMIYCMIWYAHRMFHKMKYCGSWRLSTSSVLLMG